MSPHVEDHQGPLWGAVSSDERYRNQQQRPQENLVALTPMWPRTWGWGEVCPGRPTGHGEWNHSLGGLCGRRCQRTLPPEGLMTFSAGAAASSEEVTER